MPRPNNMDGSRNSQSNSTGSRRNLGNRRRSERNSLPDQNDRRRSLPDTGRRRSSRETFCDEDADSRRRTSNTTTNNNNKNQHGIVTVDQILDERLMQRTGSHRSLPAANGTGNGSRRVLAVPTRRIDLSEPFDEDDTNDKRRSAKLERHRTTTTTSNGDPASHPRPDGGGSTLPRPRSSRSLHRQSSQNSFTSFTSFTKPLRTYSGTLLRSVLGSRKMPGVVTLENGHPVVVVDHHHTVDREDDLKSVDSVDMEPALTDDIYSLMTITNVRIMLIVW